MNAVFPKCSKPSQPLRRWQFGSRHILAATTGVATVFGLASWGGWIHSDAAVYLSTAVVAAVFSSTARRALLGGSVIVSAFFLAMSLGNMLFVFHGRGVDPRSFWIFAGFLTVSALILRLCTKAGAMSLAASLILAEVFVAIVIVYTYGYPTLFEAFGNEHRAHVLQHLRNNFPAVEQWLIVAPWLAGIVLGECVAQCKRMRDR